MKYFFVLPLIGVVACNSTLEDPVSKSPPAAGNFESAINIYAECLSKSAGVHMQGSSGQGEDQVIKKAIGDCKKSGMQAAELLLDEEATDLPSRYHDYSHAKKFALPFIEADAETFLRSVLARSKTNA